ncbi:carboxy-S-adenosyl-L-methionine synthase CmoA [Sulfurospirillum sp. 1612]|uniref:carboxy-S-adenosyl-L-methionine synthase CmoA n=1 Tax=Sulfurospirillum sp. 1612 TaxID=3094835 RepID=UPI002F927349
MDKVFTKPIEKQFEFDENVATVFDDMLERSIPFYQEVIALICSVINARVKDNARILDLGCSTARTLLSLYQKSEKKLDLIGYDNSEAMLHQAHNKIKAYGADIKLELGDILEASLPKSDVIIANYMLQFIRPIHRVSFLKKIYNALQPGGLFIFSEKIVYNDNKLNKEIIDIYYDFKKTQGYSEFEISQKREALENILIPYTEDENKMMVRDIGFKRVETIFKWGNFVTFIATKA